MRGHTGIYRTAENAFMATRAMDMYSAEMFEVGGHFDDVKLLKHWPTGAYNGFSDFSTEKGIDFEKHFVMGVIANMAAAVAPDRAKLLWGLDMCSEWPPEQTARIWIYILKFKFLMGTRQATLLLGTRPLSIVCLVDGHCGKDDTYLTAVRTALANELFVIEHLNKPAWTDTCAQKEAQQAEAAALCFYFE
jgi:hypothetical protein